MSYSRVRLNLISAGFPLLTELSGRTVLLVGRDESAVGAEPNEVGMLYCENVMPTKQGLKSIDFIQAIPPLVVPDGSYLALVQYRYDELAPMPYAALATVHLPEPYSQWGLDFVRLLEVRGTGEIRAYISITSRGILFISTPDDTPWTVLNNEGWNPTLADINSISIATVLAGSTTDTYICLPRFKIFKVDIAAKLLRPIAFKAGSNIVQANVLGIVSSYNYLILHDGHTLQWSSAFDPLDFALENSLVTGAGFGTPIGLQGKITALVTNPAGFTVYSDVNAIDVDWSSNTRFPWVFRPIPNSAGVPNNRMVIVSEDNVNYAWTSQGLQAISAQNAQAIFPEVTDFLTFGKIETYDFIANTVSVLEGDIKVDIGYAGNRYVILSYGIEANTITYNVLFVYFLGSVDTAIINGLIPPDSNWIIEPEITKVKLVGTAIPTTVCSFNEAQVSIKPVNSWTITVYASTLGGGDPTYTFNLYDTANTLISSISFELLAPVSPPATFTATNAITLQGASLDRVELITEQTDVTFGIDFAVLADTSYTQALVFDVALKRWGKVVIPHVDTVDYRIGAFNTPRSGIGFMSNTGEVSVIDFSDKLCLPED